MIKYLKPFHIDSPKKRLGIDADGGYVVPELILEKCTALFSYGIGDEFSFEVDFNNQYQKPVFMFDHTIGRNDYVDGGLNFFNEGIGSAPRCKDFNEHYEQYYNQGEVLLKIDVEGAEYDFFKKVDINKLAERVAGIIVEIHWLNKEEERAQFIEIMEKITKHFAVVHTHGNNYAGMFNYEGLNVPCVPEISLINKKYLTDLNPDVQQYPVAGIDYPNSRAHQDCNLDFLQHA